MWASTVTTVPERHDSYAAEAPSACTPTTAGASTVAPAPSSERRVVSPSSSVTKAWSITPSVVRLESSVATTAWSGPSAAAVMRVLGALLAICFESVEPSVVR